MAQKKNLPAYVALKATITPYNYLGVDDDGSVGYVADKVVNIRAKFAIEYSANGLVHIRSCYNNKYWRRSAETSNWISAVGKDPIDDRKKWDCTLFQPTVTNNGRVTFVHVQLGKFVGQRWSDPDRFMYLCLEPSASAIATSRVGDYGSVIIMPQYVAFKDDNNRYLRTVRVNDGLGLRFISTDLADAGNTHEIYTTKDGDFYLRPRFSDSEAFFWRRYTSQIRPDFPHDGPGDPTDADMLYSIIRVERNIVALRCLGNDRFCMKMSRYGDLLYAEGTNLVREVKFEVVEPVLSRRVTVNKFHLDRARIYDNRPLTMAQGGANNPTNQEQQYTLNFTYTKTRTFSWNTSKSWFVSGSVSISSGIPFIGDVSIEIGGGYSEQYDMGGTIEQSEEVATSYVVRVPKNKRAIVTAVATRGSCDVPFTYTQVDRMANGQEIRTTLSDGVFTGVNAYHFDYDVRYEPAQTRP